MRATRGLYWLYRRGLYWQYRLAPRSIARARDQAGPVSGWERTYRRIFRLPVIGRQAQSVTGGAGSGRWHAAAAAGSALLVSPRRERFRREPSGRRARQQDADAWRSRDFSRYTGLMISPIRGNFPRLRVQVPRTHYLYMSGRFRACGNVTRGQASARAGQSVSDLPPFLRLAIVSLPG